jgi:hypothetical protein
VATPLLLEDADGVLEELSNPELPLLSELLESESDDVPLESEVPDVPLVSELPDVPLELDTLELVPESLTVVAAAAVELWPGAKTDTSAAKATLSAAVPPASQRRARRTRPTAASRSRTATRRPEPASIGRRSVMHTILSPSAVSAVRAT